MSGSRLLPAAEPVPVPVLLLYCLVACHVLSWMLDFSTPVYGLISQTARPLSSASHSESVPSLFGCAGSLGTNADPSPSRVELDVPMKGVVRIVRLRESTGALVLGSACAAVEVASGAPVMIRPATIPSRVAIDQFRFIISASHAAARPQR